MTDIHAIIFDIGNVLIEWQPERFYDRAVGEERRRAMFRAVDLHAMNDRVDLGEGFRDIVYETAEANPEFRDEIRMWHDCWLDMASPAIDHSVRLMRALQAKDLKVHALSNFGVESFALAQKSYDFLNEFDSTFVSGHMQVIKPKSAIFEMVETRLKIPGHRILFTDDRVDNIAAARERGWETHLFEGSEGLARRLVAEDLLTEAEAR